jgi:hypothetical protein
MDARLVNCKVKPTPYTRHRSSNNYEELIAFIDYIPAAPGADNAR